MDYKELLQQIMYIVITAILPLLTGYLISFLKSKVKENTANIEDDKLQKYINSATDAIGNAVIYVNQVYVDSLKKSGKFDKEAQDAAKKMAIEKAKELISQESKKAIETLYNDFDTYLDSTVEAVVRENKITL